MLIAKVSEIVRHEAPCERKVAILEASAVTCGLPSLVPLLRAFLKPARTLSTMNPLTLGKGR